MSALQNISKIEDSLWETADQLRTNSKLTSSKYCMPVLGVIFLRRATGKLIKQLDAERKAAVEQLKAATYLHRQIAWLQDRFPKAEMRDVPGLCKVVSRAEIEAADWSLTPGRYVGVAPAEVDEDFDFEQTLHDIHVELADLTRAKEIQANFEKLEI